MTLLVFEAWTIDHKLLRTHEIHSRFEEERSGHIQSLGLVDRLKIARRRSDKAEYDKMCIMVNKAIWRPMVRRYAPLLKSFWNDLEYVYETTRDDYRGLMVSASPKNCSSLLQIR
jgi:hypothetical protein